MLVRVRERVVIRTNPLVSLVSSLSLLSLLCLSSVSLYVSLLCLHGAGPGLVLLPPAEPAAARRAPTELLEHAVAAAVGAGPGFGSFGLLGAALAVHRGAASCELGYQQRAQTEVLLGAGIEGRFGP